MSISGFFIIVLFVVSLTFVYILRNEMFEHRDPLLLFMIPFFMIMCMVLYSMTATVGNNVHRIFLPIQ